MGSSPARMRALPTLDSLARMRPPLGDPRAAEDTLTPRPANKSAVERLAADRAKYVRSTLGSSRGPVSEHRVPEAPGVQHRNPIPSALAPAPVARRAIARKPLRPDSLVIYRQKCEFVRGSDADCSRVGLMKKFFQGSGKDKMAVAPETTRVADEDKTTKETEATWTKSSQAAAARPASMLPPPTPVVAVKSPAEKTRVANEDKTTKETEATWTKSSQAAAARPASMLPPPTPVVAVKSPAEKTRVANEDKTTKETEATWTKSSQAAAARPASMLPPPTPVVAVKSPALPFEVAPRVPVGCSGVQLRVSRSKGLQRSQSDLSSRYSIAKAESDTFFKYCGLDPDVVEALGRENFSAGSDCVTLKVRSVSMAASDSSFSRHSEDGLQEEELLEQVPSTTSVVERNARIIKWLFTCKKAKETPSQKLQGPA